MSIGFAKAGKWPVALLVCAVAGLMTAPSQATPEDGAQLVRTYCAGCHQERGGKFDRISSIRKTPEGWLMTIFRMRQVHGLALEEGVRDSIVRYLADSQGLAPSESAPGRFALERRPNAQDLDLGADVNGMCSRCHSLARVALQRRDADEWRKLAHTHVGQWPSLEYSASGRDRPWWQIAIGPNASTLGAKFPYSTAAWTDWQARPKANLAGSWVVSGRTVGGREFYGTAQIEGSGAGGYTARYELVDSAGIARSGDSKAIVYTGYEWRGSADVGGRALREVYAVSEDGRQISGRWFEADHSEEGGEWTAVRADAPSRVLAVLPRAVKAGTTAALTIVGVGLDGAGAVAIGDGVEVVKTTLAGGVLHADIKVAATATAGERTVSIGQAQARLAVYRQVDRIDIVPAFGIARLGGGRTPPVTAQFEAVASTTSADGKRLELGPMPASWATVPFDADAKRAEDEKFAGHFDQRGRFNPAAAGPNPAREYSGDNVGNLKVVAVLHDGERSIEGSAHLIVTVQRWNTPPIY